MYEMDKLIRLFYFTVIQLMRRKKKKRKKKLRLVCISPAEKKKYFKKFILDPMTVYGKS